MQKLLLAVLAAIVFIMFAVQGFARVYPLPSSNEMIAQTALLESDALEAALSDIYFDVQIMGVKDATAEGLAEDFGVDPELFGAVYGKYTDGRFGIADVIIVLPASGCEDEAREALQQIKQSRILTFRNFDVYDSTAISENGIVFQRGDYLILLMIDDLDNAKEILEKNLVR